MPHAILFLSSHPASEACATTLARELNLNVEIVHNRRAGLAALRRGNYALLLVEEGLAEADPEGSDLLWQNAGLALPVQVNLATSSSARVVRDVRAGLARRRQEHDLAHRAAATHLENELKSSLTGLLLQSELALREPAVPASLIPRLRHLVELAANLRKRLQPAL